MLSEQLAAWSIVGLVVWLTLQLASCTIRHTGCLGITFRELLQAYCNLTLRQGQSDLSHYLKSTGQHLLI